MCVCVCVLILWCGKRCGSKDSWTQYLSCIFCGNINSNCVAPCSSVGQN